MIRNRPQFVIAYDISCPRRLQRVARILEKHALRAQKSVFLFHGDRAAVERLLDEAARAMNPREDVIQAWQLVQEQEAYGILRGTPLQATPAGLILGPNHRVYVAEENED